MLSGINQLCRRLHTHARLFNLRSRLRAAQFDSAITQAEMITAPVQLELLTQHIQDLQAEIRQLEATA